MALWLLWLHLWMLLCVPSHALTYHLDATGWTSGRPPLTPLAHMAVNVYPHLQMWLSPAPRPHLNGQCPLTPLTHMAMSLDMLCIQSCLCTWLLHAYMGHIEQDSAHITMSNDAPPWLLHAYQVHLKRWPPLTPLAHVAVSSYPIGTACTTS